MYLIQTPKLLRALAPLFAIWEKPVLQSEPAVYLTFDDGPHPTATPLCWTVSPNMKRRPLFCIGKNVVEYPEIYHRILEEGHVAGNHTHNHLNGWHTKSGIYVENTRQATQYINSKLFRPPYGRIKRMQANKLHEMGYSIVMWSLLSGDFDVKISPERCLENVVFNLKPGDIVVFHDSEKAWERMSYVLPRVLEHCKKNKWAVKSL